MAYGRRGLGQSTAGTYQDPNCPLLCWVTGNILDMELLGQMCWPCHNVCPPGTGWDPNLDTCDTSGAGLPEAISPAYASGANPCPTGQTWNASDGQCENPMLASLEGYIPWIVGGLGIVAVLMIVKK